MFECDSVHLQSASTKRPSERAPNLWGFRRVCVRACASVRVFVFFFLVTRRLSPSTSARQADSWRNSARTASSLTQSQPAPQTVFFPAFSKYHNRPPTPPSTSTSTQAAFFVSPPSIYLFRFFFHFSQSAVVFHSSRWSLPLLAVSSCHRLISRTFGFFFFSLRPSFSCSLTRPSVVLFIIRRRVAHSHSAPPLPSTSHPIHPTQHLSLPACLTHDGSV